MKNIILELLDTLNVEFITRVGISFNDCALYYGVFMWGLLGIYAAVSQYDVHLQKKMDDLGIK